MGTGTIRVVTNVAGGSAQPEEFLWKFNGSEVPLEFREGGPMKGSREGMNITVVPSKYSISKYDEMFVSSGDIIIKTSREWYFPDGRSDKSRTLTKWKTLIEQSIHSGKKRIRVVGDMSAFFRLGLSKELLDYELSLERKFSFPMTALCAYNANDLNSQYSEDEIESLKHNHSISVMA